jgi:hypothetical protein
VKQVPAIPGQRTRRGGTGVYEQRDNFQSAFKAHGGTLELLHLPTCALPLFLSLPVTHKRSNGWLYSLLLLMRLGPHGVLNTSARNGIPCLDQKQGVDAFSGSILFDAALFLGYNYLKLEIVVKLEIVGQKLELRELCQTLLKKILH